MLKLSFQTILNIILIISIGVLAYGYFLKKEKQAFIKSSVVLSKYQGMIDASAAYKEKAAVWQSNLDTLSKEMQQSIETYNAGKGKMTDKEQQLSEELIETRRRQLLQYEEGIKQKAQMEDQALAKGVLEKVNQYLKKYGEDKGYSIIFAANETGNIVYGSEAIDITETVIEGINKEYKK